MTKSFSKEGASETRSQRVGFVDDAKGDDFKTDDYEEKILALDISTKTGWAVFARKPGGAPRRVDSGTLSEAEYSGTFKYPWNLLDRVLKYKDLVAKLIARHGPDYIVIEETNLGSSRYTQKALEFIHLAILSYIYARSQQTGLPKLENVVYLSTTTWRSAIGLYLSEDDKKNNKKLKEIKKMSKDAKKRNELKKQFGVTGAKTPKHVAVRYANEKYGLSLLEGQNDEAEALCLGDAFFAGAKPCTGR